MKKEINNSSNPVLQTDKEAYKDNSQSTSTVQDKDRSMQRRRLLKGLGAAPLVMTLHNGAAMAASSTGGCVGQAPAPDTVTDGCVSGTAGDHDSFLRVKVDPSGKAEGYNWGTNGQHPFYDNKEKDRNLCLVSVDAETGEIHTDRVDTTMLTTNSCWTSFT